MIYLNSPQNAVTIGMRILCVAALFLGGCNAGTQNIQKSATPTINDVTQLNPIVVDAVVVPHSLEEIVQAVKNAPGRISIGGGRFSMGGQTATEHATQIDMREYNRVIELSTERKEITVQSGATWRQVQEAIDPYDLSVQIMQSYANFTVGGALSVNAHGRYIGLGPVILSVKSIGIVLADGSYLTASPTEHADIFYGAIGGYGGIGVITEATLALADNVRVHRVSRVMPLERYQEFFRREIRDNPDVIFQNADIYPDAYDTVRVTSYEKTDLPLTRDERLIPADEDYGVNRSMIAFISEAPGGKMFRQHLLDPYIYSNERVTWRNYEASYSVAELEPESRTQSTYVLQEYFVPVDRLESFVPAMAKILNDNAVNVMNISIRHAHPDSGSLLSWAQQEVFAFVLYYKQGTSQEDKQRVGDWTRQLIDAAIAEGGRYYLPYQIHATTAQFKAAYPGWEKYFELKKTVDPTNKFSNKLLDAYFNGAETAATDDLPNSLRTYTAKMKDYRREQEQTYLTMPEWFLVFSPDEYANYIDRHAPSGYPYFGSISQFWGYYRDSAEAASDYPFNGGYHLMVSVIGSSFTVENAVKGAYENSIGRLSEWTTTGDNPTQEDRFAVDMAKDYVTFVRVHPWYEFDFWARFKGVWTEPDLIGANMFRKWERKFVLSGEYLVKAGYGGLIKLSTKAIYGDADDHVYAIARNLPADAAFADERIAIVERFESPNFHYALLSLPRYEEFQEASRQVFATGASYVEIAGNRTIMATVLADSSWQPKDIGGRVMYERPILTESNRKRVGLALDVAQLNNSIAQLDSQGIIVEHLYDY